MAPPLALALVAIGAATTAVGARLAGAATPPAPPPVAMVEPCDAGDKAQRWALQANTLFNAHEADGRCLEVAGDGDGQAVRSWECRREGGGPGPDNQVFGLDTTTTPPRVTAGTTKGPLRCLVLGSMGNVLTLRCDEATPGSWIVYDASVDPALRLGRSDATSLCLSAAVVGDGPLPPPSPPPPPPPPLPPYTPVPQACTSANTTGLPFCNTSLAVHARVADLLGRMTADEKLTQLIGGIGGGVTPAVPSVQVPPYQYHNEGLHGLRSTCDLGRSGTTLYSTMFPQVCPLSPPPPPPSLCVCVCACVRACVVTSAFFQLDCAGCAQRRL